MPHVGDRVVVDDVALTVLEMDAHRISRVRVAKVSAEEDFEELTEEQQLELTQDLEFVDHHLVSSDSGSESEAMADEKQAVESLGVGVNSSQKNQQVG